MNGNVDGTWSLVDQENTLNFYQQLNNAKLTSYTKHHVLVENVPVFQQVPMGTNVPAVKLCVIPVGGKPADVQPPGTTPKFDHDAYVNGVVQRVAVFS